MNQYFCKEPGDIVLIGCPTQQSGKRLSRKGGEENGPCCLRRFLSQMGPSCNIEYGIDASRVKVQDYGNVPIQKLTVEQAVLQIQVTLAKLQPSQIPITLGGTKESTLASSTHFLRLHPQGKLLFLFGNPNMGRLEDNSKLTSENICRKLQDHKNLIKLIGVQDKYIPKWDKIDVETISPQMIHSLFESDRLNQQQLNDIHQPRTALGRFIRSQLAKHKHFHLSVSMEVIEGFRGTETKLTGGFCIEQIFEAMFEAGKSCSVRSVDLTEFNPAREDVESSFKILNMIYYFVLGFALRTAL